MDAWCEQMRANRRFTLKRSARKPAYDEGCLDRMTIGMPWHGGLWLILNTCDPQDELTVDVTDFLDAQLVSAAELNHDSAIQPFLNSATRYAPVIVLTEGRTDVEVLSGACALLFPELTEYVRFFDFAVRPEGGATMLTTLVRSFAASHIVNRVVAVYDNDAAGRAEYDKLVASATPANIRVIHYPSLEAHREYPTTEGHPIDAGGFGASIELYLGTDVLAPDECGPLPLRRTGGHDGGRRQWSLRRADKEKAMKRFRAKVNAAHAQGLQPGQDWSGLTSILQAIFSAFADEAVSGFPEVRPSLVREASYIQPFG